MNYAYRESEIKRDIIHVLDREIIESISEGFEPVPPA